MHLTHPLGITTGEVVVDRDHVNATTGKCIEVTRQGGDQGLALASFHLSDLAFMEDHATNQLNVEMAHT